MESNPSLKKGGESKKNLNIVTIYTPSFRREGVRQRRAEGVNNVLSVSLKLFLREQLVITTYY